MSFLARWWPVPAVIAIALVVQQVVYTSRYDVGGHAAEHLGSGSFVFLAAAVAILLLWLTPSARRAPIVVLGLAAWVAAGVAIAVGNVRVVDALIESGQPRASTDTFVGSPAIDDAHWLADTAPFYAVVAAMVVVAGLVQRRAISVRFAIVCAVLNVLIPYWILPGFGLVVVTIGRAIARERTARATPPPAVAAPLAT